LVDRSVLGHFSEHGVVVVGGQHRQDPRRELRVGAVVEGQRDHRRGGGHRPDQPLLPQRAARHRRDRECVQLVHLVLVARVGADRRTSGERGHTNAPTGQE